MKKNGKWHGRDEFRSQIEKWAETIGVRPKVVTIRDMTQKWASCSTAGRLTFNSDLLEETPEFGEYVIVHELLHLRIPHHGKLFQSFLKAYLPKWSKTDGFHCGLGSEIER